MKLPRADQVHIDDRKVREHLLSRSHPVGRFKERFFAAIGFDETTATAFVSELRRIAESGEVDATEFGGEYTVPGELSGPAGVGQVVAVWIQETGGKTSGSSPFVGGGHEVRPAQQCGSAP